MVGGVNIQRAMLKWLVWPVHRAWLGISNGRAGTAEPTARGMGTLVLTTVGRKSGEKRSVPVYFVRDGARLVLVASNAGDDRDPAWYLNLVAQPEVGIVVGRSREQRRAREATGDERERLWPELVRRNPGYARYERRTDRRLPVVILDPIAQDRSA